MKITKRQLRRIIKEEKRKLNESGYAAATIEEWAAEDDAVEQNLDGSNDMYTDSSNGGEELEYIIRRLKEVYALGGEVSMIKIEAGDGQTGMSMPAGPRSMR